MKIIKQFNRKYNKRLFLSFIAVLIFALLLISGFLITYARKIENRLQKEAESTLQHVSSQNVLMIKKEILSKQKFLKVLAQNIEDSNNFDIKKNIEKFKTYVNIYDFYNMGIINKDGICYTTLGKTLDLSEYQYYKDGLKGISGIFASYESEDKTTMLNIYTVPIYKGEEVEMILTATYSSYNFSKFLNITSFDGLGGSIVLDSDGKSVTISQDRSSYQIDILDNLQKNSPDLFTKMKNSMAQLKEGYIEYSYKGEKYIGFYEPIDINDWYLISYVPKAYIHNNVGFLIKDIKLASIIICIIFCMFAILWVLYYIKYQKGLSKIVFYDSLTQKENYEYLKLLFETEKLAGAKNKSLFVLDIDKFKVINIMYGVSIGDKIIVYLSHVFSEVLPEDKIYRNKADEFVGIMNHCDKRELIFKLEALNNRIMQDIKEHKISHINISIGICALEGYTSLPRIYSNALIAKNDVKGKTNEFYSFFDDDKKEKFVENKRIESDFDTALQNREFEIWYQPKYNMRRGKL